jgi:hypothetical protein
MGYTTEFSGHVTVEPPLNQEEIDYLNAFSRSRRVKRTRGPYFAEDFDSGVWRQEGPISPGKQDDVIDGNSPPEGQPGLWCQWVPSDDGTRIEWDGGEKFYSSVEWMSYSINHFLKPDCYAKGELPFLQANHICNGEIEAEGEESGDVWKLVVTNNRVQQIEGRIVYDDASDEEE